MYKRQDHTRVVRESHRGVYDRAEIYLILDEGFVCHVGFVADQQPFVIPTLYARVGDDIYFHGSAASRMLRNVSAGVPVCLTVTLVAVSYTHLDVYKRQAVDGRKKRRWRHTNFSPTAPKRRKFSGGDWRS